MTTTSASGTSLGEFLESARQPGRSSAFAEQAERFQQFIDESMAAGPDALAAWPSGKAARLGVFGGSTVVHSYEQLTQIGTDEAADVNASREAVESIQLAGRSLARLREAMAAEGLDPESVQISFERRDVGTFDGTNVLELLQVETADGKWAEFSAQLTEESPGVTVCVIRHMIEGTGGWGAEAAVS
jgi:hypothetical protein